MFACLYFSELLITAINMDFVWTVSSICYFVLDTAAIFTNILLVVLILLRQYTRKRAINQQIILFSATTCLRVLGPLITAIWATPGYHACRILNFMGVWAPALSDLILLLLNVDRFLALLFPKIYAKFANRWYSAMMLVGPLVVTIVVYLSLILGGEEDASLIDKLQGRCIIALKQDIMRDMLLSGFVVPMIIVLLLSVTTMVTYSVRSRLYTETPDDLPEGRTQALVTLGLVNVFYIGMWLPLHVFLLKTYFCTEGQCFDYTMIYMEWLGYSCMVVTPLLWSIHKDIRSSFGLFCCICRQQNPNVGAHDNIAMT